jgi:hypothetical protein
VRLFVFSPWAARLQDGADFLRTLPAMIMPRNPAAAGDEHYVRLARLDCDWHGEIVRALGAAAATGLEFLPAQVTGRVGLADLIAAVRPADEEWWFVLTGQHPQGLVGLIGPTIAVLARRGVRTLYYAFDEASRRMPAFAEIAPHLAVLIHDEFPLDVTAAAALRPGCRLIHRSWVANVVPFAVPCYEEPEAKIVFVGSQLGLSPHRQRQMDFLARKFRDRFLTITDHSLPVAARGGLARYRVGFCPEGRNFTTAAMSATHTDRPFWSGTLGLVPVCEDSAQGGRLEALHAAGLIQRYPHGDLPALATQCEAALAAGPDLRRRIYEHFNRHETIGAVVAGAIAGA